MLDLRRGPLHLVSDKGVENVAKRNQSCFEPVLGMLFPEPDAKGDCGHDGLLTNLTAMMCRRSHRNARRPGIVAHKKVMRLSRVDCVAPIRSAHLCGAYEGEPEAASISYAAISIFEPAARKMG
jgi:hypothetical protein